MSDLTTTNNENLPAAAATADAFVAAGSEMGGSTLTIIKLSKNGEWVTGVEAEPMTEKRFAADVKGAQRGWVCFVDGEVVDEQMALVGAGQKIEESNLEDHGPYQDSDGWTETASIQLRSIESGEEFAYRPTSLGGLGAIGDLLKKFGWRRNAGKSGIPIIDLGVSSYEHRKFGKVYKPHFKIVGWQDEADLVSGASFGEEFVGDSVLV